MRLHLRLITICMLILIIGLPLAAAICPSSLSDESIKAAVDSAKEEYRSLKGIEVSEQETVSAARIAYETAFVRKAKTFGISEETARDYTESVEDVNDLAKSYYALGELGENAGITIEGVAAGIRDKTFISIINEKIARPEAGFVSTETLLAINPVTAIPYWGYRAYKWITAPKVEVEAAPAVESAIVAEQAISPEASAAAATSSTFVEEVTQPEWESAKSYIDANIKYLIPAPTDAAYKAVWGVRTGDVTTEQAERIS